MFDYLLTGAEVVTPEGPGQLDVGIAGSRIAAIGSHGSFDGRGEQVVDLTGKILVPGGIDPHIHCDWPVTDGAGVSRTAASDVVSRAALYGGTTTLVDFVPWNAERDVEASVEAQCEKWSGKSYCDYSFHVILQGKVPRRALEQLPGIIGAGFPSIKIFTTDVRPTGLGRKVDFGSLWEIFKVTGRNDGIVAVHGEEDEIVMHMYDKLISEGKTGIQYMAEVHNAMSEDLAFRRVIRLAQHVDGASMYMMHVSAALGAAAIAEAKAAGVPIYGETLHQYILHTQDDYLTPYGALYHTYPSLKTSEDTEALWRGLRSGVIATVATDELCTSHRIKTAGDRIDNVTGGNTGVEPRMAIVYTEMVVRRGFSLLDFVNSTSANAARVLGFYPRKGAIRVGSDADLAVIDPNAARVLHVADLHESDYTPWEGWEVDAWPTMTFLRGKPALQDGELRATLDSGELIPRKLARAVLDGTAV